MAATAAMRSRLRAMIAEATEATYTDDDLDTIIERYPRIDERGEEPYDWDTTTSPPTQDDNEDWMPTYDLNLAAADVWEEKAAASAQDYDVSADGATMSRSQVYEQCSRQASRYRSRRSPTTITQRIEPKPA